jgi:hypothetical protein
VHFAVARARAGPVGAVVVDGCRCPQQAAVTVVMVVVDVGCCPRHAAVTVGVVVCDGRYSRGAAVADVLGVDDGGSSLGRRCNRISCS